MTRRIELPDPWIHVETLPPEEQERLELSIGPGLTYEDLEEHDVRASGIGKEPRSRKSWLVMGHRWNRIRNNDDGTEAIIRLQTFDGVNVSITSVAFPSTPAADALSGATLRSLPVAALAAAYSYDEHAGRANLATFLELIAEVHSGEDPLAPLPEASNSAKFSALVARQYRAVEEKEPGVYAAQRMSEINNRPLPTIQRWITQARKAGFLPPARTGRRPNDA